MVIIMKTTIDELQQALVDGFITQEQFFEVLCDNFGLKRATDIMIQNLNIAVSKYAQIP